LLVSLLPSLLSRTPFHFSFVDPRYVNCSCRVIFPLFLLPAFLIGFAYRELAIGYLNTGRDLRRMESNTRSPIFSDFGELLEGIVTVRAFSAENRFLDNLHTKVDTTTQVRLKCYIYNPYT
jgi:ABC-type multidrug transport system fused ATPase/permease subunit